MGLLLGFTCLCIICVAAIAKLMLWVTDKSAAGAITSHFKAAEYILEHHEPPPEWRNQKKKSVTPELHPLIERLDKLILFFQNSPFFETEDARIALLEQLNAEREHWIKRY